MERFEAAAHAGFTGAEYLFPYEHDAADIADRLKAHRLTQVMFNLPPGDWAAGERGIAILPERKDEFRDGVTRAAAYATALGCKQIHCLAGIAPESTDHAELRATYLENLRHACVVAAPLGIRVLIEPINTRDIPGYFLTRTRQALDIMAEAGADNLDLQYDAYHMQIMEGDLARTIEANMACIGHIQIAGNPGRNEPDTGEVDFAFLFRHLDRIGYSGWVGCEYRPRTTTAEGLGWFDAWKTTARRYSAPDGCSYSG